jgi:hypothetical protein
MPKYMVLISQKGGYLVHSVHDTLDEAKSWQRCKLHDGEDVSIAVLPEELLDKFEIKE